MSKGNLINVSTLDLSKTITNFSENVQVKYAISISRRREKKPTEEEDILNSKDEERYLSKKIDYDTDYRNHDGVAICPQDTCWIGKYIPVRFEGEFLRP